jgi:hypothetical protein
MQQVQMPMSKGQLAVRLDTSAAPGAAGATTAAQKLAGMQQHVCTCWGWHISEAAAAVGSAQLTLSDMAAIS